MALARHLADLGEVSAGAAHEFRNAAAAIDGFADLALRRRPGARGRVRAGDPPRGAGDEPRHERLPALRPARGVRSGAGRSRRRSRRPPRARPERAYPGVAVERVGRVSGGRRLGRAAAARARQPAAQRRRGHAEPPAGRSRTRSRVDGPRGRAGGGAVGRGPRARASTPRAREKIFLPFYSSKPDGVGLRPGDRGPHRRAARRHGRGGRAAGRRRALHVAAAGGVVDGAGSRRGSFGRVATNVLKDSLSMRALERLVGLDDAGLDELRQRLIHRDHPLRSCPVWIWLLMRRGLALADRVGERRRAEQDLEGRRRGPPPFLRRSCWATTPRRTSARTMRTCSCSAAGKASMMRSTAFAAEFVWTRREDEQARLRRRQRHAHRLEVAHLADEQAVGVLADRGLDALGEARHVGADLALREDGLVVGVHELDRVLDRDDVVRRAACSCGRGSRRASWTCRCRSGPSRGSRPRCDGVEPGDRRRQVQVLGRRDARRDQAEHRGRAALLAEEVDAEARLLCPSGRRSPRRRSR